MINETKNAFLLIPNFHQNSVAYFIWKDPYMVAANQTFIQCILKELNFKNVFSEDFNRYPEVNESQIIKAQPNLVLLSSEPFLLAKSTFNTLMKYCQNQRSY